MTTKELHINFDIAAQEVSSSRYDEVTPEEKDILLNNAMRTFVQEILESITNPTRTGFQETVRRYDDLEALYETTELPLYMRDEFSQFTYLPADYMHYDISQSKVYNNCIEKKLETKEKKLYVYYLTLPISSDDDSGITSSFWFRDNGVEKFNISHYPKFEKNIYGDDSRFLVLKTFLDTIQNEYKNKHNVQVYFERFNGEFRKNTFIFVSEKANEIYSLTSASVRKVELKNLVYDINNQEMVTNRLIRTSDKYLLSSKFGNTKYSSPIVTIENGRIMYHVNKSFKGTSLMLGYLRTPKRINIFTDQTCELAESAHLKIVNKAVQFFKAISNSPEYQNLIKENLTI